MHRMKHIFHIPRLRSAGWQAWLRLGISSLVTVALVVVGLIFRYAEIGSYIILAYGLLAVLLQIHSDTTFKMLLIVIGCMPVLSVRGDDELLATLSIYAFLLLDIGTITAVIEQITSGKKYI